MDQDDFRKLLASSSSSSTARPETKRSREQALGGVRSRQSVQSSSVAAAILAPRTVKTFTGKPSSDPHERRAPSRIKLADGYTDRSKRRGQDSQEAATQEQIESLKRDMREKRISHKEYLARVGDLSKGDFAGAGLVRGLDRRLLQRVRAGEDVVQTKAEEGQDELDAANAEEELDAVLDQSLQEPPSFAAPAETAELVTESPIDRDAILSRIKKSQRPSAGLETSQTSKSQNVKFKPITKRNVDGTTTETHIEKEKKIKIIRSAEGSILKKLVKKVKPEDEPDVPPNPVVAKSVTREISPPLDPATPTKARSASPVESIEDVFADVGDYDPFDDSVLAETVKPQSGTYFDTSVVGDEQDIDRDEKTAATAEEFLRRHRGALEKAAAIVDRKAQDDQARLAKRKQQDAGFGLVFRDGDAYAGDVREVPEDDEVFDPQQRRRQKIQADEDKKSRTNK